MVSKTRKKRNTNGKYRSGLEQKFAEALPKGLMQYEPFGFPYTIHKNYLPDFVYNDYLIECKGFFREGDTQKYKAIRDQCETEGLELVFLLSDPNKKVRKGAKLTMGQWCDKEGLRHFTLDTTEELIDYVVHN